MQGPPPTPADPRRSAPPPPPPAPKRSRGGALGAVGWVLFFLAVAAGALGYVFYAAPQAARLAAETAAAAERQGQLEEQRALADARAAELAALRSERDQLSEERASLASTVAERDQAIAELSEARAALEEKLSTEIADGDILVRGENGELSVELKDKVLFGSGESELSERGSAVLQRVAESLASLDQRMIEVSGHTDSTPLSDRMKERYPTNWELSTARATNVVRFLAEQCGVPGERLFAAGYSEFHPIASNRNATGRRRNRRIELTLRPMVAR